MQRVGNGGKQRQAQGSGRHSWHAQLLFVKMCDGSATGGVTVQQVGKARARAAVARSGGGVAAAAVARPLPLTWRRVHQPPERVPPPTSRAEGGAVAPYRRGEVASAPEALWGPTLLCSNCGDTGVGSEQSETLAEAAEGRLPRRNLQGKWNGQALAETKIWVVLRGG